MRDGWDAGCGDKRRDGPGIPTKEIFTHCRLLEQSRIHNAIYKIPSRFGGRLYLT
jgi:hypothetical protein